MDQFYTSSFGQFLMTMFAHYFIPQSFQSFMTLAHGWSLSSHRHTISTYLWLSGAVSLKHFSRYYAFLSGRFFNVMDKLWSSLIVAIDCLIPEGSIIHIKIDSTTRKKSGAEIHGRDAYRNGAGTARQEYRTLLGLHFVVAIISITFGKHHLNIPIGIQLYLKERWANTLELPFRSRSQLARELIDRAAHILPHRIIQVTVDGDYATKAFLENLPPNVHIIGRFPIDSKLYHLLDPHSYSGHGRPRSKGKCIGAPRDIMHSKGGWMPHPDEAGAQIKVVTGIWHSVLPKQQIQVVVLRRLNTNNPKKKVLEAFYTTYLQLTPRKILEEYRRRWDIEIDFRDANAYYGLAKDQCRKYRRIVAINNFRMLMAASRTLFCIKCLQEPDTLNLTRFRPWYRQKKQLSQLDIDTISREIMQAQGIFQTPCFIQDVAEITKNKYGPRHWAA